MVSRRLRVVAVRHRRVLHSAGHLESCLAFRGDQRDRRARRAEHRSPSREHRATERSSTVGGTATRRRSWRCWRCPTYAVYHLVDKARGTGPALFRAGHRRHARSADRGQSFVAARALRLLLVHRRSVRRCARAGDVRALATPLLAGGGAGWSRRWRFLATPVFPYATSLYGHSVAAGFLALALAFVAADPDTRRPRAPWRWRAAGACFVLAAGAEYIVTGPALVMGLVLLGMQPKDSAGCRAPRVCRSARFCPRW